jgi:hypothetical protein
VEVGKRFGWGSIDPIFQKLDADTAIRVSNAHKYIGKTFVFAPTCGVRYRPTMHVTKDGVTNLCGADSPWAAHIFYARNGSSFVDGDWCHKCFNLMQGESGE